MRKVTTMSTTDLGERPTDGAKPPANGMGVAAGEGGSPAGSPPTNPVSSAAHRPPRWWGVVVGLVAAGLGLAVGEFVAGLARSLQSPIISVAERVRDFAPEWLVDFAKRNFGTGDKGVAIWTIIVVIA